MSFAVCGCVFLADVDSSADVKPTAESEGFLREGSTSTQVACGNWGQKVRLDQGVGHGVWLAGDRG